MHFLATRKSKTEARSWNAEVTALRKAHVAASKYFLSPARLVLFSKALVRSSLLSLFTLLFVVFALVGSILCAQGISAQTVQLSIDVSMTGATIDHNIFGQFAEHLGHGIYEGIWVGPDSNIPNTRGIRNDVVAALRALKVPNIRWPGGCFADEYHWRKGIGPSGQRPTSD